jgi:hypothetical protein
MKSIHFIFCLLIAAALFPFHTLAKKELRSRKPMPSISGMSDRPAQQRPDAVGQVVQNRPYDAELTKRFKRYDLLKLDGRAASHQIRDTGRLVLRTSTQDFDISMVPNDLRSPDYTAQVIGSDGVAKSLAASPVTTFKGSIKGQPSAQVRLSLAEKGLEGAVITQDHRYFFQPAQQFSKNAQPDEFVLYEAADLNGDPGTCGVTLAEEVEARKGLVASMEGGLDPAAPIPAISPMKIVRLATDADAEFVSALGGAAGANAQILSILNMVDGIYQVEIGLTFQVVFQNTWADEATDPYSTSDASPLLAQFRNHWNANFSVSRSLAHLWTGKNLTGSTIGIASLAVVCRNPTFSYGLSQRFPLTSGSPINARTIILTTHEIGHNFSAYHTNQVSTEIPPDIERSCDETIMEASVGDGLSFCPLSRSQVIGHANAYSSCLSDTSTPPPTSQQCQEIPLDPSGNASGQIANTDCASPSRGVQFFADRYTFNGTIGQQISITLDRTSGDLNPYLYLIAPDGFVISQVDDGNGGVNSKIPAAPGTITLPATGTYVIEATSFGSSQTGGYSLSLSIGPCSISVTSPSQHFATSGGSGAINVTLTGAFCENYLVTVVPNSASSWLVPEVSIAFGSRPINFTVQPNASSAGRRAFLVIAADANIGTVGGGIKIPITQSGTGPDCVPTAIGLNQTLNGNIGAGDCHSPVRGAGFFADRYSFNVSAGQQVAIKTTVASPGNPDLFLTLLGPNGAVQMIDDDSGGGTDARIPGGTGMMTLGLPGTYIAEVTGFLASDTGDYSIALTGASASTIQFTQPTFTIGEAGGSLNVGVARSGDASGSAIVEYLTNDTASNSCNQNTGAASSRCDYLQSLGSLRFAPGETSKSIIIPIVDDAYLEGSESFSVTLNSLSGATLGSPSSATVTITDNDASQGANPIDDVGFFVRQHYIDFLNREPDTAGLNFWTNEITSCGADAQCIEVKRINVSAAFFLSIEFQQTGYFVERVYKAAYGSATGNSTFGGAHTLPVPIIRLSEFLADKNQIGEGVVVGAPGWEQLLDNRKQAFVDEFMQRPRFVLAFPGGLPAADFVDLLNQNAGNPLSTSERNQLINDLMSGAKTRSQVVRAVAEDADLVSAESNRAFVMAQYHGYLRRNPNDTPDSDYTGYDFWLSKLNQFTGNFVNAEMVKAFLLSGEYRHRFGP